MRVLALAEATDHVCVRYRLAAFAEGLRSLGCELNVEAIARGTLGRLRQARHARRFDAVLIQRRLLPAWQLAALRRHARHLVFDFDDAVLYRDSYDPRGPDCPKRRRRFTATVRACDAILAGNEFLAAKAREVGADPARIRVIPTCVEPDDYGPVRERPPGPPTLVWIGSSSTLKGLERSRTLWDRVGATFPEVTLRVICDRFPDLGRLRIDPVPWDEATEIAALTTGDVGLAWTPDDLWSRGKCGLKVLQYLAAGMPVVANPVGVHLDMVRPGVTGFLAESPTEWLEAIGQLVRDPSRRAEMGRNGRTLVDRDYAVSRWTDSLHRALQPAAVVGGPHRPRRFLTPVSGRPTP